MGGLPGRCFTVYILHSGQPRHFGGGKIQPLGVAHLRPGACKHAVMGFQRIIRPNAACFSGITSKNAVAALPAGPLPPAAVFTAAGIKVYALHNGARDGMCRRVRMVEGNGLAAQGVL